MVVVKLAQGTDVVVRRLVKGLEVRQGARRDSIRGPATFKLEPGPFSIYPKELCNIV